VSEALYERYKDALRRGHVAALRGHPDEAFAAYDEAAGLAPDRALPHVSKGAIHLRAGRVVEALAAYGEALNRAPRDETALAGRAEALIGAGRRVDAAETLDLLADLQEVGGRLTDACDTARRALEQAESKPRRRHVEALTKRLRSTAGDQAAEQALARALSVLEGDAAPQLSFAAPETVALEPIWADRPADAPPEEVEPEPDPFALAAEADAALDADDRPAARDLLLRIASGHARADRSNAAIDACYIALAVTPADPDLHLALVDLYLARGWRALAAEKLALLGRLMGLLDDPAAHERLCAVVAVSFPDDPRLVAICA
jgi:tetratricopeptide (TPR) repeat protein